MRKWFIAFIVFISVFMTTRELMNNEYSFGDFNDIYAELKNDILIEFGATTEVLGRDETSLLRKSRVLVFDLSNNENNSTVPLADSTAFFDFTGTGFKEKTSWIYAVDGILVLDKNHNGQIDGIYEVFGKTAVRGLEELKRLVDSNDDNLINREDQLYSKLMIWQDHDQDGRSQPSELKTLVQSGIKEIELDKLKFNVNLSTPLFYKSGRFVKNNGDEGLVYEARLTSDPRISIIDTVMIPNYTIHHETDKLPKLRGYGTVLKSDIAYNSNENLRKLTFLMSKNIIDSEQYFDQFIEEWSGFNTLLRTIQKEYNLSSLPIVSEVNKKIWIYSAFTSIDEYQAIIEQDIIMNVKLMKSGIRPKINTLFDSQRNTSFLQLYKALRDRYSAFFTLQMFYPDVMEGVSYNYSIDEFVIKDLNDFTKNVSHYFNNPKVSLESKRHLANIMHTLHGTFLHFNVPKILECIGDPKIRNLVSSINKS